MASDRPDHTFTNSVAETALVLAEFPDDPAFQVFVKDRGETVPVGKGESITEAMDGAAENMSATESADSDADSGGDAGE